MKLKIRETAWGINRIAGGYREKVTAEESFSCAVGALPPFGRGGRRFTVDAVENDRITLSVHCADPKYDRTWTLEKGGELTYRPRSFDGGYIYDFRLK